MTAFVVVNPRSGGGRTKREWRSIERALGEAFPLMSVAVTRRRGEAKTLVREALLEGHSEIIAVGGDGTINEAVNGFFDDNGPIAPDAVFGFGIAPGAQAAIARLKTVTPRKVDVGRLSCITRHGEPMVRYFINIASFGMSGMIVDSVNRARIAKLFGGSFAFAFHSLMGMLRYGERTVRIRIDGNFDEIANISTVAVANGQFFGGGMKVAPNAKPDDGTFDVVIMGGIPRHRAAADTKWTARTRAVYQQPSKFCPAHSICAADLIGSPP
jgi:diacylglycerol kinase family enzyme